MPDASAGQSVVTQAQELGADVLARLDMLTQQAEADAGAVSEEGLERRKKLAQEAIDKMNAIVEGFIAAVQSKEAVAQEERTAANQAEIERIKASIQ
jgi:hypothetical protein